MQPHLAGAVQCHWEWMLLLLSLHDSEAGRRLSIDVYRRENCQLSAPHWYVRTPVRTSILMTLLCYSRICCAALRQIGSYLGVAIVIFLVPFGH